MNRKIGVIGLGNMGSAFYQGLMKLFGEEQLWGYDRNWNKGQELSSSTCTRGDSSSPDQVATAGVHITGKHDLPAKQSGINNFAVNVGDLA